jgi:hypothetical protein
MQRSSSAIYARLDVVDTADSGRRDKPDAVIYIGAKKAFAATI